MYKIWSESQRRIPWPAVNIDILRTSELKWGGKNTWKNYTKKDRNDPDNHNGVISHLEPDILEYKASGL